MGLETGQTVSDGLLLRIPLGAGMVRCDGQFGFVVTVRGTPLPRFKVNLA
jgi:hypothetical protein